MDISDTFDTVKHYFSGRMRRKKMPYQQTRSVRVTAPTYILARLHAEEQNITIQESMSRLVGIAMTHTYMPEEQEERGKGKAMKRAGAMTEQQRKLRLAVQQAFDRVWKAEMEEA